MKTVIGKGIVPTFLEFFSGGGMARAGLGAGWNCLLANDIDPNKAAAYAANWGGEDLVVGDIAKISASSIASRADLAWASFPCQDLSLAGNYEGLTGARSGTFWAFWRLIRNLKLRQRNPRMIVLENVYGILTSHDGGDFEAIVNTITKQGYLCGAMVIDAIHFTPQSRPRVFILAIDRRLELPHQLTSATPDPAWHPAAVIKAFNRLPAATKQAWLWWTPPKPAARLKTLDDVIEKDGGNIQWHADEKTLRILRSMTPLHCQKIIEAQAAGRLKVGTIYNRTRAGVQRAEVRFDGISGCLRTPSGGSSRQTVIIVDGPKIRTRLISPREAARLMGLPETYVLPTNYNDAYYVCGDGVVVDVVRHLREHLLDVILSANQHQALWRAA